MADPIMIIGAVSAIDGSINLIERSINLILSMKNAKPEMQSVREKLEATNNVVEKLKAFLTSETRRLDDKQRNFWLAYVEVLKKELAENDFYLRKYRNGGVLDAAWYASMGKNRFLKLIRRLEEWSRPIDRLVSIEAAEDIDRIKTAMDQIQAAANETHAAVGETHATIISDMGTIMESLERVETFMRTATVRRRELIRGSDEYLRKIAIDFSEIHGYTKPQKARPREWKHWRPNNSDEDIPVLIERVVVGRSNRPGPREKRENFFKLVLELEQLRRCHNILRFHGYVELDEGFLLISDGTITKTLRDLISSESEPANDSPREEDVSVRNLTVLTRVKILKSIADACLYLHESGIFHKDIHSSNIFIDEETMHPRLSGFTDSRKSDGMSTRPSNEVENRHNTLIWQAPERCGVGEGDYTYKCDVYSFGVLVLEVGLWVNLDEGQFEVTSLPDIQAQKEAFAQKLSGDLGKPYGLLATECIQRAARDRPTIEEVVWRLDSIESLL